MKIIIFIIIACTLFVAWSLCVVGASADEQLEMIYAKDLERKEQREKFVILVLVMEVEADGRQVRTFFSLAVCFV